MPNTRSGYTWKKTGVQRAIQSALEKGDAGYEQVARLLSFTGWNSVERSIGLPKLASPKNARIILNSRRIGINLEGVLFATTLTHMDTGEVIVTHDPRITHDFGNMYKRVCDGYGLDFNVDAWLSERGGG